MIYLDNAATTRVFDGAVKAAQAAMSEWYFNPNTTYPNGVEANSEIEKRRRIISDAVGARNGRLVFTSCATESNNWVLGCCRKNAKGNVVISAGEHSSVYEPAMQLKNRGVDVRVVPLDKSGTIDENAFYNAIDENTTLISVIHVSNETGIINPIERLIKIAKTKAPRALFHSDGVQGMLKSGAPIDALGVDLYSASAHKLGAPKGIGLLYIKNGVNIAPFIVGGGQEQGLRSGTQNTPYIAAFAAAVSEYKKLTNRYNTNKIYESLTKIFTESGCKIIGEGNNSGYILCVCVPGVKAEILQNAVNPMGVVIGKGAACSGSHRGNRVLSAMGLSAAEIECCIRISTFVDTDCDEAVSAAKTILSVAERIRSGNVG